MAHEDAFFPGRGLPWTAFRFADLSTYRDANFGGTAANSPHRSAEKSGVCRKSSARGTVQSTRNAEVLTSNPLDRGAPKTAVEWFLQTWHVRLHR
jgi:hypothetical protein